MVIKTPGGVGAADGYRLARRIEQIQRESAGAESGDVVSGAAQARTGGVDFVQVGHVRERTPRVKIYALTRAGRKQLQQEEAQWQRATSIVERFLKIQET